MQKDTRYPFIGATFWWLLGILGMMLALSLLLSLQAPPTLPQLNELAEKTDIKALAQFSTGDGSEFRVLKGGAYDVGSKGWKVLALSRSNTEKYVVFSTPLTSQDTGELLFKRVGSKLQYIDERERDSLRLKHHRLNVRFNIPQKEVSITDAIDVNVAGDNKLGMHVLRLSPCYRVKSFKDKNGTPVAYAQTGGIITINPLPAGAHTFTLEYSAIVDLPGFAGSITPENATLTNDYWYPMVNRMPSTYDISVEGPKSFTTIGQGKLIGEEITAKGKITKYKMELPVVYWSLTCARMENYQETFKTPFGNRMIQMWSPRVPKEKMVLQPKLYAPILDLFSEKFAPFPFESYGALDSPTYGGGALEAYSFATYGGGLPAEDGHETGHTWWGGMINNTYLTSFWNESFAVWVDRFYNREVPIGSPIERRIAHSTVSVAEDDYNEASLMKSGAAIGPVAGSLGYGKGAYVLDMLEQLVGTDNIVATMKEWQRVHPKGEPGEWEDYERVVLRKLPQFELKNFFDDWFRRPGFANVDLIASSFSKGIYEGQLRWNGPKFRMPLEIWLQNAQNQGLRILLDTNTVGSDGKFSVTVTGFAPVRAYLDPYHKALRRGNLPKFNSIGDNLRGGTIYRDPNQSEFFEDFKKNIETVPSDLNKCLIVGHPDTTPVLKELCAKVGFGVQGDRLTYKGTTINLKQAGAIAVVDLAGGGKCVIALGVCHMRPNTGHACVALVDDLGRLLRASTIFPGDPTTSLKF